MAATKKKILTFNISEDTYNRVAARFPKSDEPDKAEATESTMLALIEAAEKPATKTDEQLQADYANLQEEYAKLSERCHEKISALEQQLQASQQATEQNSEQAQSELRAAEQENDRLTAQNSEFAQEIARLLALLSERDEQQAGDDLAGITDEFTRELLYLVTERLREKTNTPTLTPMQVLLDGFLKYNVQQYNLWFYDFVVSKSEILRIANKYNPQIDSLKKLQKALGIYE